MLNYLKSHWVQLGASLLLLILVAWHVLYTFNTRPSENRSPLYPLEVALYDERAKLTMAHQPDDRVVVVNLDEASLSAIGQWPWPRDVVAKLVKQLTDHYGVSALGFDVVFAENDSRSPDLVLKSLQSKLPGNENLQALVAQTSVMTSNDQLLANALMNRPVILGYTFSFTHAAVSDKKNRIGQLPSPSLDSSMFVGRKFTPLTFSEYTGNLPVLQQAARRGGYFTVQPDPDGILRRVPMVLAFENGVYEPLALALVRQYKQLPPFQPVYPANAQFPESLRAGAYEVPIDQDGQALIPFRGRAYTFPYISAASILKGEVPKEKLAGKIAILGTNAPGLLDLRSTSTDTAFPGVEVHANLVAGILDQVVPARPAYLMAAEYLQLLILFAVLAFALGRLAPLPGTAAMLLVLGTLCAMNYYLWAKQQMDFPLAASLVLVVGMYAVYMVYGYFFESRRKKQMASLFGQYVPPELVKKMSDDPEKYRMDGQSRELTILFSDVRSFTTISESLSPEDLRKLMNEFLSALTEVIRERYRGTIDKYMGDCVMAFWGAPVDMPDHATQAVLAALDMQVAIARINPGIKQRGMPELAIGVGVNTGKVTVGDMGSRFRQAYTVMGDAVNLASRLEGITKQYGVGIVVGEVTRAATTGIAYRELDKVRVKGKAEPVAIFEPVGLESALSDDQKKELQLFHQVLKLYRQQQWDVAELQLMSLQQRYGAHGLYDAFLARIKHFRTNPPPENWDGVYDFETK